MGGEVIQKGSFCFKTKKGCGLFGPPNPKKKITKKKRFSDFNKRWLQKKGKLNNYLIN